MLTDTHAHLTSETFREEMESVLDRAAAAGVSRVVAVGCDVESSAAALTLAERFPSVYATVGLHPTYVTEEPNRDWREQLRDMARHPRCVGIGETGLDFYHPAPDGWTWEKYVACQQECFEAQLELAASAGKNVVVHQRDRSGTACWEAIRRQVQPWQGKLRAVFHCWLHPWDEALPVVAAGHLISFTGIATYRSAAVVDQCAAAAHPDSFMLETDSPYLAPVPQRGKRNEPSFLRHTAERIASRRSIPLEELARQTTAVADGFFGFASSAPPPRQTGS